MKARVKASVSASTIPYCVAAMLGYNKASRKRTAINYEPDVEGDLPLKTLIVQPVDSVQVLYHVVIVKIRGGHGIKGRTLHIKMHLIHSVTNADSGESYPFTDKDRKRCRAKPVLNMLKFRATI